MAKYKALADAEDASRLVKLGIDIGGEESKEVEEEANQVEVGRSEELTGSTTNSVEPPPKS